MFHVYAQFHVPETRNTNDTRSHFSSSRVVRPLTSLVFLVQRSVTKVGSDNGSPSFDGDHTRTEFRGRSCDLEMSMESGIKAEEAGVFGP